MVIVAYFSRPKENRNMAHEHREITGIVLAGGKSRRMGVDKGLMLYQGKPMISYSISLLKHFCSRIIISTSNTKYEDFGLPIISDSFPNAGPLGGLYSVLKESTTDINICLPCDLPKMKVEVLRHMLSASSSTHCVVPLTPQPEPLVAIYPSGVLPILHQLLTEGNYKMTEIYNHFPVHYIPLEEFPGSDIITCFTNLNSPADL